MDHAAQPLTGHEREGASSGGHEREGASSGGDEREGAVSGGDQRESASSTGEEREGALVADSLPSTPPDDPFGLFAAWFAEASAAEPNDANAMALASVDEEGMPNVRVVLMKGCDARGFVFYTNAESAKGTEVRGSLRAAAAFHWKSLRRQVRLRGPVEEVSAAAADAYFATRPRESRIGAHASRQSRPLESRAVLEGEVARLSEVHTTGDVPRPAHWTGFRIRPLSLEFWQDRPFRLHDRLVYRRASPDAAWETLRLYP